MNAITTKQAAAIAQAALTERNAFGNLPVYAVERAAEEAGFVCADPIDASDARSKTALAAYVARTAKPL